MASKTTKRKASSPNAGNSAKRTRSRITKTWYGPPSPLPPPLPPELRASVIEVLPDKTIWPRIPEQPALKNFEPFLFWDKRPVDGNLEIVHVAPNEREFIIEEWPSGFGPTAITVTWYGPFFLSSEPQSRLEERVLTFFNQVREPKEIVDAIRDDPLFGSDSRQAYGIRPALAKRILQARDQLPDGHFTRLGQLASIRGVGADTLHDVLFSFTARWLKQLEKENSQLRKAVANLTRDKRIRAKAAKGNF